MHIFIDELDCFVHSGMSITPYLTICVSSLYKCSLYVSSKCCTPHVSQKVLIYEEIEPALTVMTKKSKANLNNFSEDSS